jgi:hypothetical protein
LLMSIASLPFYGREVYHRKSRCSTRSALKNPLVGDGCTLKTESKPF